MPITLISLSGIITRHYRRKSVTPPQSSFYKLHSHFTCRHISCLFFILNLCAAELIPGNPYKFKLRLRRLHLYFKAKPQVSGKGSNNPYLTHPGARPPNDIWCILGWSKCASYNSNFRAVHEIKPKRFGEKCKTKANFCGCFTHSPHGRSSPRSTHGVDTHN